MPHPHNPESRPAPNPLSGHAIAEQILVAGEIPPASLEALPAETTDDPFANLFLEDYIQAWQFFKGNGGDGSLFDDFQADAEIALDNLLELWAREQEADDTEVWKWAQRLFEVGKQQIDLDVTESIVSDVVEDQHLTGASSAATGWIETIETLPLDNIVLIYGELARITIDQLDAMGVTDETERLRALDDIVLQARDVSQHHLAHFGNRESDEVVSAPKLRELAPTLSRDEKGRYRLGWEGRIKTRPKDRMLSRTQHCAAAYQIEGKPSAIERLGWAFNTELKKRGLLAPGAAKQPAPAYQLPAPVRVTNVAA